MNHRVYEIIKEMDFMDFFFNSLSFSLEIDILSPGWRALIVFFDSLQIVGEQPDKMLGGNRRWTRIPSRDTTETADARELGLVQLRYSRWRNSIKE